MRDNLPSAGEALTKFKRTRDTPNYEVYESNDSNAKVVLHVPKYFQSGDPEMEVYMVATWTPKTMDEVRNAMHNRLRPFVPPQPKSDLFPYASALRTLEYMRSRIDALEGQVQTLLHPPVRRRRKPIARRRKHA